MAEYIEKWSVVNRLIDIENEFQQYKPFHDFDRRFQLEDEGLIDPKATFRWSMLDDDLQYTIFKN